MPARLNAAIVRTQGDPSALAEVLRRAVTRVHRNIFKDAHTLRSQVADSLLRERLLADLFGFLKALAMLLACVGIYGVMAYGVTRRTSEIGVRMALGAVSGDVVRMVLREALLLALLGIAIGLPVALWLAHFTRSFLFGLQPNDPVVLVAAGWDLAANRLRSRGLAARLACRANRPQHSPSLRVILTGRTRSLPPGSTEGLAFIIAERNGHKALPPRVAVAIGSTGCITSRDP